MNRRWIPGVLFAVVLLAIGLFSATRATSTAGEPGAHEPPEMATVRSPSTPLPTATPSEAPSDVARVAALADDDDADRAAEALDDGISDEAGALPDDEVVPTDVPPTPLPDPVLPSGVIAGSVVDGDGPVADATVRVQLTQHATLSAEDGAFVLADLPMTDPVIVTAWAHGYYIGHAEAIAGLVPVTITLWPYPQTDNLDYTWFEFDGVQGSASCEPCHPQYEEWLADAHSQSAINPRFVTMYEGTDVHGNRSPDTLFGSDGMIVNPDPDSYYGPGVKTDYPDRNWNCAACHVPMASNLAPSDTCGWSGCHREITAERMDELSQAVDATGLEDVNALDGVGCDFCHKIGKVYLDPETGLPYADRPGISSMKLFRPEEGEQLFFGTADDDIRRVSKLPLLSESAFCAPCHYGVFSGVVADGTVEGGVVIYNSYGEWLESPYSDPETGQTCQECHMLPVDYDYFVYPEQGGLVREGFEIHDHRMLGINDLDFMQESLTMTTTASLTGERVVVRVEIHNDNTGHHIPTGAPQRHLILVVQAVDAQGNLLSPVAGPVLPEWTGNYAGRPGEAYAKVLRDEWSGEIPSAAYWRDVTLVSDNRIAAFVTATTDYAFAAPEGGEVRVEATLWYRRSFQYLAELKGWEDDDLLMANDRIELTR